MNILAINPDPPNPISSFLKTFTLDDSNPSLVLPVIIDTDLDLSELGLGEVFMHQLDGEPTVEEDDVLHPSPPPPIFPPPHLVPNNHIALITHQSQIQNTCLPLMMSHLLSGMKNSLICIHGALVNSRLQIPQLPKSLQSSLQD